MSKKRTKDNTDKSHAGDKDDHSKIHPASNLGEKRFAHTFDGYRCSGNMEVDFPELCALLEMKKIPNVCAQNTKTERNQSETTPCIQIEKENDIVKSVRICGLKVDHLMDRVLNKALPSLTSLQSIHFWQARLRDEIIFNLKNTISLCSNLRTVVLEGNPLPEHSYHLLLSEDSFLTHLSLRNNRIGDDGARLIGSTLSTAKSANKNLISLNLGFNLIGDAGAAHIAQGLRWNRSLLSLSLSNNQIADTGAGYLAKILCPIAVTHEELVERRIRLMEKEQSLLQLPQEESPIQSNSSLTNEQGLKTSPKNEKTDKKDEKASSDHSRLALKKGDPKSVKKSPDAKGTAKKNKSEKTLPVSDHKDKTIAEPNELVESVVIEKVHPLLETSAQHKDDQVILLGNEALQSLNLAGNLITEKVLPSLLLSLQTQTNGGLLRLSLQRNRFLPDCASYLLLQEFLLLRNTLNKNVSDKTEEGE